jgi:hypothetical protein
VNQNIPLVHQAKGCAIVHSTIPVSSAEPEAAKAMRAMGGRNRDRSHDVIR